MRNPIVLRGVVVISGSIDLAGGSAHAGEIADWLLGESCVRVGNADPGRLPGGEPIPAGGSSPAAANYKRKLLTSRISCGRRRGIASEHPPVLPQGANVVADAYERDLTEHESFPTEGGDSPGFLRNGRSASDERFLWQSMLREEELLGDIDEILDGSLRTESDVRQWQRDLEEIKRKNGLRMNTWLLLDQLVIVRG